MTTVRVRTPSLSRFHRFFFKRHDWSILRCLEYESLLTARLAGRVLDFGGGGKTNYSDMIPAWADPEQKYVYESANIDPASKPTHLLRNGCHLPVAPSYYDTVISLNTFEHVRDLSGAFREIHRILRSGGRLAFMVPFIFRVHGHPDDFIRGTPSYWEKCLHRHGFDCIQIDVLNWGPFSTAHMISGAPGPFKIIRRYLALLTDIVYFAFRYGQDKTFHLEQDAPIASAPIGYFIDSTKK